MTEEKNTHGGHRQGSGRKKQNRIYPISVKISPEAKEIYDRQSNKNKFIDELIINSIK